MQIDWHGKEDFSMGGFGGSNEDRMALEMVFWASFVNGLPVIGPSLS